MLKLQSPVAVCDSGTRFLIFLDDGADKDVLMRLADIVCIKLRRRLEAYLGFIGIANFLKDSIRNKQVGET